MKFVRVNMTNKEVSVEDVPQDYIGLGGRGMGAVMGAKGLKAIVVDRGGKSPDAMADPEAFKEGVGVFVRAVKDNLYHFKKY